jgi:hypothetical protein
MSFGVTLSVCCSHCVFCGHNQHKDITSLFCLSVLLFYHTVRVRLPKLNQTDGLFQIVSRRATFNLNKRTKIAGRLLCPLYLIYSGSPVGPFWVNFSLPGAQAGDRDLPARQPNCVGPQLHILFKFYAIAALNCRPYLNNSKQTRNTLFIFSETFDINGAIMLEDNLGCELWSDMQLQEDTS